MATLTFDQAAALALAAGFPQAGAVTMVAIMAAESSLDPLATCDAASIFGPPGSGPYFYALGLACTPSNAHVGPGCGSGPWTSFGLGQVNTVAHYAYLAQASGSSKPCDWATWLFVPANNAQACLAISGGGTEFGAWTTYTNGAYKANLAKAQQAVAAALQGGGGGGGGTTGGGSTPGHIIGKRPSLLFVLLGLLGVVGLGAVGEGELHR